MMFSKSFSALLATLFIGMTLSFGAYACSTDGWDVVSPGGIDVGSPFGAVAPDVNGIPRFEEFCAMRASAEGFVQSNAPSHARVRGRFYIFADLAVSRGVGATPTVLRAYSDEAGASELFEIRWDGGSYIFDATANGGGSASLAGDGGWDMIEFDWDPAGSGNLTYWVNSDATQAFEGVGSGSVDAGAAATMESMQLGLLEGLGTTVGNVYYDSVELRNETAIGPVFNCDADPNSVIEVEDAIAIVDELFLVALSSGTPDCDSNAVVEVEDAIAVVDIIFAP